MGRILRCLLIFSFLLALQPQPAWAAAPTQTIKNCRATHKVQAGETLLEISKLYRVKWQAIVEANKEIENPSLLYVGWRLCIPRGREVRIPREAIPTDDSQAASFTARISRDRVEISTANFPTQSFFYVKADDGDKPGSTWHRLGLLRTSKYSAIRAGFLLPEALQDATTLNVCLKNAVTDAILCNTAT